MSQSDASPFRAQLPPFPDAPPEHRGHGELRFRYEDIAQDGRLGARPTSHAIGAAVWRAVLDQHPITPALLSRGILPILTRLVVSVGGGPIGVRARVWADGGFELVESVDDSGKSRFRADMWAEVRGIRSRTFGPPGEPADEIALGAMWAEHVLTRPFAPAGERSVERLPEGLSASRHVSHVPAHRAVELPEGARWLDASWEMDATEIALGVGHTDSNQHVNSLVYPQLLEDAALRRLAARALPFDRFVTRFEMAYRKPSFAGDRLRLAARLYERTISGGRTVHGLAGVFASAEEHTRGLERARVFGTAELEP